MLQACTCTCVFHNSFCWVSHQLKSRRATTAFRARAVKLQHPSVQPGTQTRGSRDQGYRSFAVRCACKAKLINSNKGYFYVSHTRVAVQPCKPNHRYLGAWSKDFKNTSVHMEAKSHIVKNLLIMPIILSFLYTGCFKKMEPISKP